MIDQGQLVVASLASVLILILGALYGSSVARGHEREIQCSLRYEMALTPSDSLTVIREYDYCTLEEV